MSEVEVYKDKEPLSKLLVKIFLIFILIVLPALLVLYTTFVLQKGKLVNLPGKETSIELGEGVITTNQLWNSKDQYVNKKVTVQGKTYLSPIVCTKQDCPSNDYCCGCSLQRDLVLNESQTVLVKDKYPDIRVLSSEGLSLCHRVTGSCDYTCQGWEINAIYNVTGFFKGEKIPGTFGQGLYLESGIWVLDKTLISKQGLSSIPGRIFRGIKEIIGSLTNSNYLVLP